MINEILADAKSRMNKSIDALANELAKIRTGRAHPSILDHVMVDYYGSDVPINQVANVNVEDSRMLSVQPWEKDMVAKVEKAILTSDLGLNPATAGMIIRVPMPPLTEERRRDLVKVVRAETENGRIAVRNIRRDAISDFKELLKEKDISEDEEHKAESDTQVITDEAVKKMDAALTVKEAELMEI